MADPKFKPIHIAIIGGGIGGVILGIALAKFQHITFTIYESRAAFGEIGAGIGFGANSHLAMSLISPAIWEGYKSRATYNGWVEKQDTWFDFSFGEKGENDGKRIIEVRMREKMTQSTAHRAHFLEILVKLLPEGKTEFNKRLVNVDQSGEKVICEFADGTRAKADAVIGCDGIKSSTRPFVYDHQDELVKPIFTKKVAYRGLVPMKAAEAALGPEKANNRQMYIGHGGHVLTFPIANGTLMNVVAFRSYTKEWEGEWVKPLQKENAQGAFPDSHWGKNIVTIMEDETDSFFKLIQNPDAWAIFQHPEVSTFHQDRISLLGDAAHAMTPHFGQGAGMAIEDAYVLSNLLGECTSTADLVTAFEAYDSVRVPRTMRVTSASHEQGKVLDLEGDDIGDDMEKLAARLNTAVRWIWYEDMEAHLATAKQKIDSLKHK
ncbi:hypothetical protein HYFRA_00008223 [Hymenoscyphus fraxineus]|uniref:FAD-binding domain-containing protein n=1 Tax=Hymenoscyphus fraxineus TaxID=746836 RepID=A0A9N9PYY8_9HELO|nr:hypothetical protein HYFRA_00008223 [Hymenoscyphus fraxineus]